MSSSHTTEGERDRERERERSSLHAHAHFSDFGDRKGTTKKLCDKDSAERSGELSDAIRLKTFVLLDNDW